MDIAGVILGVIGRITEGASLAVAAAMAKNEEQAFAILEQTLTETAASVISLRAKIDANKADALKALDEKFPATEDPTKP